MQGGYVHMYCKHCGSKLADWQKTCHICGTPVDLDSKENILDDIDFSKSEELSDEMSKDESATKIFDMNDEDLSKTQDLSALTNAKDFKEKAGMEFEDVEPEEMNEFDFDSTEFEFDDEADMAQKERAGVIEDLFYGETDDDGEVEDELAILRESNKNKQMSIIAILVAVAAILIIVLAIIIATNMSNNNKRSEKVEITTEETTEQEGTTQKETITYKAVEKTTEAVTTTKKETTTEKKTKKETTTKETTTAEPETTAPTTTAAPATTAAPPVTTAAAAEPEQTPASVEE